jgi:hypothetical protein
MCVCFKNENLENEKVLTLKPGLAKKEKNAKEIWF